MCSCVGDVAQKVMEPVVTNLLMAGYATHLLLNWTGRSENIALKGSHRKCQVSEVLVGVTSHHHWEADYLLLALPDIGLLLATITEQVELPLPPFQGKEKVLEAMGDANTSGYKLGLEFMS